ncbi:MAG TPA: GlcNAc-PI de-N-acetylase [Streptomyces sp.]|nr:GlcNAc-PI de-N-acetylase [Streptomyces sp.]
MALPMLDDDDFRRVLCVVAHPDDTEYGLSAVVHHWVRKGAEVAYLLLTAGEAGMQRPPAEAGPLRAREQRAACDVVGVRELDILDHPDGTLVYSLDLRRDVARRIRQFRPDAVVTNSWAAQVGWGLNHADHRVAGLVTADACRDADNRWVFPELADEGLEKWHASKLLVYGDEPTHGVALGPEDVDAGIASLACHEQYLADLPGHPAPEEFIGGMLAEQGKAIDADHAYLFAVHEL